MAIPCPRLSNTDPLVVGSVSCIRDLKSYNLEELIASCDIIELRLDLLDDTQSRPWQHLKSLPMLFTARREEEGGSRKLNATQRCALLQSAIDEASLIDIEVASIAEMEPLIRQLAERQLPWVASYHNFKQLPDEATLVEACEHARKAGAHVFKLAAQLREETELERLVKFQSKDHGILTATMGMGVLGAQSRVRCAKAGSVLNYGYLGTTPTAPGQMSAGDLKRAVAECT